MAFSVVSRVAGLGALTAAGQLLIIGSLPAYSKIFDPGMYGEYVIFVGAYTVISVLAGCSLRFCHRSAAQRRPRGDTVGFGPAHRHRSVRCNCCGGADSAWSFDAGATRSLACGSNGISATVLAAGNGYRGAAALPHRLVRPQQPVFIDGLGQFVFCLVTVIAQLSFVRVMAQLPALIWGYRLRARVSDRVPCDAGLAPAAPRGRWEFPCAAWLSWRASTADSQHIWWATRWPHRCVTGSCRSFLESAPVPQLWDVSDLPIE